MSSSLRPHGLYNPWNSLGQNTAVGSCSLLQGIFLTQGSNPGLPHCRRIFYQLSHKGSPRILEWVAYPFSSGSFQPRNRTGVSCIASRFFTNWAIREVFTYLLPYLSTYLSKNWKLVPSDYLHPIPTSPMPHLCNHKADLFFCVWICLLVFDV